MIGKFLCSIFLIGILIQVNEAKPSFIIIAEYIPKIASSAAEIFKTVKNGSIEIAHFYNQTNVAIESAHDEINKQIVELDELVEVTVADAEKMGKNITACVDEEFSEIQHITFNWLDKCGSSHAVKHLCVNVMALTKEEASLAVEVSLCIVRHPLLGDKLKDCFDKELQDIDNKIEVFNNEVETTLQTAKEKLVDCVETNLGNLHFEIKNVTETFKTCTK